MPKKGDYPEPKPPTISLLEGKQRLQVMRDKGYAMLKNRPLSEGAVKVWANTSFDYIKQTFGENNDHLNTFRGQVRVTVVQGNARYDAYAEQEDAEKLLRRVEVLDNLIDLIDQELSFSAPRPAVQTDDFWSRLHPSVVRASKSRFKTSHYADAVEAAFKDLNSKIKEHVRKATGQEFDGADLMNRAFSLGSPVVRLADLSTEDGKNIQKGYLQIFAGAMTGIRNPKAHSNVTIDANRAIHHLHLASLLHYVFDERL
jgi:uncharacterized protein (TIGR02391 family)